LYIGKPDSKLNKSVTHLIPLFEEDEAEDKSIFFNKYLGNKICRL